MARGGSSYWKVEAQGFRLGKPRPTSPWVEIRRRQVNPSGGRRRQSPKILGARLKTAPGPGALRPSPTGAAQPPESSAVRAAEPAALQATGPPGLDLPNHAPDPVGFAAFNDLKRS